MYVAETQQYFLKAHVSSLHVKKKMDKSAPNLYF